MTTADDLCEKMFNLRAYSPETQDHVKRFVSTLDKETITKATAMMGYDFLGYSVATILENNQDAIMLREYMRFAPRLNESLSRSDGNYTISLIPSLHGYKLLDEHQDYSKADNAVQRQCEALLWVSLAYRKRTNLNFEMRESYCGDLYFPLKHDSTILDHELVSHLLERPDDDRLISDVIWERDLMAWDDIKEFLAASSNAAALTSGIL